MTDSTRKSAQLIETLQTPSAWPESVSVNSEIKLIETHISWVLLTDDFAWKIKKPVQFDFLDFSTLERREHFCREELRLNRRFAPELYLDVVPIAGTPEQPQLELPTELSGSESDDQQQATPFEFAVRMKRFDQSNLLSRLADDGPLDARLIDELADCVAEFHESADLLPDVTQPGCASESTSDAQGTTQLADAAHDNFDALQKRIDEPAQQDLLEHLEHWTDFELASLKDLLENRRRNGAVRHCHGDLHLGNIALVDNKVCLFDCIEFNEEFRWIDVMSEVAFVVMDLEERGQSRLAWQFLNRYLERTGDYEGVTVLPFFLVYRAMVRAKVDAIRLADSSLPRTDRQELRSELSNCLDVADDDHDSTPPALILMHGVSGSGKSHISQQLLECLPAIRVRSDVERKRLFDLAPEERPAASQSAELYSAKASQKTYERLLYVADTLLLTGYPVIVDATFLTEESRRPFLELAARHCGQTAIVECTASRATLQQRVRDRASANNDASDADGDVLRQQLEFVERPASDEAGLALSIDTEQPDAADNLVTQIRTLTRSASVA